MLTGCRDRSSLELSVIVPTYNRRDSLLRLLWQLERQQLNAADRFEVIVSVDGSTDGTVDSLAKFEAAYSLQVVVQANAGPAAARNRGVRAAHGNVLLFIDDDVDPSPTLVAQHLAMHADDPDAVVLGPILTPASRRLRPWGLWEARQLARHYADLRSGRKQPGPRFLFTGNVSVRREHALAIGGFDESFRRGEDVEFGYRLAERGLHFRYAPDAVVLHEMDHTYHDWLRIPYSYGTQDVVMARDHRRPDALRRAYDDLPKRNPATRAVAAWCVGHRRRLEVAKALLEPVLTSRNPWIPERVRIALCGLLFNVLYWQAVAEATSLGQDVWRRGADRAALSTSDVNPPRGNPRTGLLILLAKRPDRELARRIEKGEDPRAEYLELARANNAEILDFHAVESSSRFGVRRIARWLGPWWGLAWLGFLARRQFGDIYATGEDVGLRLALLLRAVNWYGRLTLVIHNADTPKRRAMLGLVGKHVFRNVICLTSAQQRVLVGKVGLPENKVHVLPNWVDQHFYAPAAEPTDDYILSVGMERRDYPTLQAAAHGLPYRFHVVGSGWSPGQGFAPASGIRQTSNITLGHGYSYRELRELYARARFVVVPLKSVPYAAGVTGILEGMAMAKAVIASASPGIIDYIEDGVSGRLVPVGDVAALRKAIIELWDNPTRAAGIGQRARVCIESRINTDGYVASITQLLSRREITSPPARAETWLNNLPELLRTD